MSKIKLVTKLSHNNKTWLLSSTVLLGAVCFSVPSIAQTDASSPTEDAGTTEQSSNQDGIVTYTPEFFDEYFPVTALDLVERVPGFTLDRGDNVRGFGGAAGNVLIDGERPSTKSDSIENILSRIGKGSVERIELIRGATGGLDLGGQQTVVVNVVRKADAGGTIPWELQVVQDGSDFVLRGNVAYTDKFKTTDYTLSLERFGFNGQSIGFENLVVTNGPNEFRDEIELNRDLGTIVDIKTDTKLGNGDSFRFNVRGLSGRFKSDETSIRTAEGAIDPDFFVQDGFSDFEEFEISSDYEHAFSRNFAIKVIGLVNREFRDNDFGITIDQVGEDTTTSRSLANRTEGETIGRLEFDYSGWKSHTLQFGGEIAENFIDNELQFIQNGEEVPLPGSNTVVNELRGEFFASDSWTINPKFTADLSLAVEVSRIQQTGDVENSRTFVFPKPRLSFTYVPNSKTQWRLRLEQEVGQLNFFDFVSSANFDDADLDFGNPDLQPDRTLVAEATFERRFRDIGVLSVTLFYNYVQDLIDLIPTSATTEATGNVGNGTRYGTEIMLTSDLDVIGIPNSRLDASWRIQDSTVDDLVTGETRRFSNERPQRIDVEFRKEVKSLKSAFGFSYFRRNNGFFFGVDEFIDRGPFERFNVFWESTLPHGIRARVRIGNVFNQRQERFRTVFDGTRGFSDANFVEERFRRNGTEVRFTISGVF